MAYGQRKEIADGSWETTVCGDGQNVEYGDRDMHGGATVVGSDAPDTREQHEMRAQVANRSLPAKPDLEVENDRLRYLSAEDRIRWEADTYGMDAVLLSSMQKTASVLMHMFHRMGLNNEILFGDTGYHFRETLQLRDELMRRYGLNIVTLYPEQTPEQQEESNGRKLYLDLGGQKECCRVRKADPYLAHMARSERRLTMVGLRRSEGGRRNGAGFLMADPRTGGHVLHPIYDWSDEQIEAYLEQHRVPVHPLHEQDYPSIGCACCTTPVRPGEDPRAGRWRHLRKDGEDGPRYCKILLVDGAGI